MPTVSDLFDIQQEYELGTIVPSFFDWSNWRNFRRQRGSFFVPQWAHQPFTAGESKRRDSYSTVSAFNGEVFESEDDLATRMPIYYSRWLQPARPVLETESWDYPGSVVAADAGTTLAVGLQT